MEKPSEKNRATQEEIEMKRFFLAFLFATITVFSWAQENTQDRVSLLKENIKASPTADNLDLQLEELLDTYSKDNRFEEFYNFLETLEENRLFTNNPLVYYYKALARFRQVSFLEENKMWEELFANKDTYANHIDESLAKVKQLNTSLNSLTLRSKLLEWQIIKAKEGDTFDVLEDLFKVAGGYAHTQADSDILKDVADGLFKQGEINYAKRIYNIYVSKISETETDKEKLKKLAEDFLKEDKINLAVSLYNDYLQRLTQSSPQDKNIIIKEMLNIAQLFTHSGWQEGRDPFYAKEVYEELESLYGQEAFDGFCQYARAYNLERIKKYRSSFDEYLKLVNNFDDYPDKDRIYFRLGVLSAYVFGEIGQAKKFFLKVANESKQSKDYLNSLYHLGLLNHWQGNLENAQQFYGLILETTQELKDKPEITLLATYRIEEIKENKDIEYNLRMFLDNALNRKESKTYLKVELFAKMPKLYVGDTIKFKISSFSYGTGCLQKEYSYLWSGELGTNKNPLNASEFDTSYYDIGTKVVGVVLVGPDGVVDGTLEMADVYQNKIPNDKSQMTNK